MHDILIAIVLGIIEGLTEFIPISSTGHLILVEHLLKFTEVHAETFSIAIQLGAILAVVYEYPHRFMPFLRPSYWISKSACVIYIAILPALLSGFLFYSAIKTYLFTPITVIAALALGGLLMILIERFIKPDPIYSSFEDISYKEALMVGLAQCFSLWPGMSRSATTIMGGLMGGLTYQLSAQFSFIIAVPVMSAAVSYDLYKNWNLLSILDTRGILTGFVVAFVVALLSIRTFIKILNKWRLFPFACYRLVLAGILLFFYFIR